jgi:uncharacterized protein YlxW (UPF0749 family)
VAPPYVIEAIGDPATLETQFLEGAGGGALDLLNATYGIRFDTESVDELTVPAANESVTDAGTVRGGTP